MKFSLGTVLALAAVAFLTAVISTHTVFVFLWWALVAGVVHGLAHSERNASRGLLVFTFYSLLAIVLYVTQLWSNPTFYGFSGDGMLNSVGTDDSYFYSLVAYDLPYDFPSRFAIMVQRHNYADVLGVLVAVHRRLFPTLHPLDLLFFNTFGLSFFPFFVRSAYRALWPEDKGDRWAFVMALIAPFVLANGVILMRDGLVATAFVGGLVAAMHQRWWRLALALAVTAWLRPESGVMLAVTAGMLALVFRNLDEFRRGWARRDGALVVGLQGLGLMLIMLVFAQFAFGVRWWEILYRGDFLRNYIGQEASQESGTSTFYTLSQLPLLLRLPTTLLFYIGSPFLALGSFKVQGLWVPRAFLLNIFGLMFPIYAAWFYRGVMRIVRSRHIGGWVFLVFFLVNLSLVTQASMQLRHKIPMQSMFYILTAYGMMTPYKQDRSLGWAIALFVAMIDIVFNVIQLKGS